MPIRVTCPVLLPKVNYLPTSTNILLPSTNILLPRELLTNKYQHYVTFANIAFDGDGWSSLPKLCN